MLRTASFPPPPNGAVCVLVTCFSSALSSSFLQSFPLKSCFYISSFPSFLQGLHDGSCQGIPVIISSSLPSLAWISFSSPCQAGPRLSFAFSLPLALLLCHYNHEFTPTHTKLYIVVIDE
uniref:Uncharacterized protein n=1 Tax=Physcomitrium patens TaxID=3218 RepID=A0A2K1J558_PHYPA|nr:hypothetical protein PHYPA_022512 [Physcomitrium patens]